MKALVVEDNTFSQIYLEHILMKFDFEVRIACNGFEAIKYSQEESFDIIFMDVNMPFVNGKDATMAIRTIDTSKNIDTPIILQTSMLIEDFRFYTKIGFTDVISKSYSELEITKIIKKYVNAGKKLN